MVEKLVTGTVRALEGKNCILALPEGELVRVRVEGGMPKIGADIIGLFDVSGVAPTIRLVPDIARVLMEGRTLISVGGRPEYTARMLAMALRDQGPSIIGPGVAGMIERTPTVSDADLAWSLNQLLPKATELSIGLNVIDPIALAKGNWSDKSIVDELLPADAVGERSALTELRRLMADAFSPACRRSMTAIGRGRIVPSVDFILPYSPFATGLYFSNQIGGARAGEIAVIPLDGSTARRLSSFREIVKAFAPRYLGRVQAAPGFEHQAEEVFADVAAAAAFLMDGGEREQIYRFKSLRETALLRDNGETPSVPATHEALALVLSTLPSAPFANLDEHLAFAASIASYHAPKKITEYQALRKGLVKQNSIQQLDMLPARIQKMIERNYADDLKHTLSRLSDSPIALGRMAKFSYITTPLGLEAVSDREINAAGSVDQSVSVPIFDMSDFMTGFDIAPEPSVAYRP